jgi:hypothetical protein
MQRIFHAKQGAALYHLDPECQLLTSWWPDPLKAYDKLEVTSTELDTEALPDPSELCACVQSDPDMVAALDTAAVLEDQANYILGELENSSTPDWIALGQLALLFYSIHKTAPKQYASGVKARTTALRNKWLTQEGHDGPRMRLISNLQSVRLGYFNASIVYRTTEDILTKAENPFNSVDAWARAVTQTGSTAAAKALLVSEVTYGVTGGKDPAARAKLMAVSCDAFDQATQKAAASDLFTNRLTIAVYPQWLDFCAKLKEMSSTDAKRDSAHIHEVIGRYGIEFCSDTQAVSLVPDFEYTLLESAVKRVWTIHDHPDTPAIRKPIIAFGQYTDPSIDPALLVETAWALWKDAGGPNRTDSNYSTYANDEHDLGRPSQATVVAAGVLKTQN